MTHKKLEKLIQRMIGFRVLLLTKKGVKNIFKKLVASNYIFEETRGSLKPVVTKPGIMYGLWKVHKDIVHNFPSFRPILSATNTNTIN